jgi:superfamily II DNA or RNA helicase
MDWIYQKPSDIDLSLNLDADNEFDQKLLERGKAQEETASIILEKLKNYPGVILGDEVGMGKTWVALLVAIAIAETRPVLVLTPSKILSNQWQKQYFNLIDSKLTKGQGADNRLKQLKDLLKIYDDLGDLVSEAKKKQRGIFVSSIGAIDPESYYKSLDNQTGLFALVILDEGHNFKNESTKRYQIFKTTRDDRGFKQPLNSKMHRILLLTATPFQLGHTELNGVLRIFEATCAPDEQKTRFNTDVQATLAFLDKYQKELRSFEYQFKNLSPDEYLIFKSDIAGTSNFSELKSNSHRVNSLYAHLRELKIIKTDLNNQLLKFLIRNTKDKSHRAEQENSLALPADKQLLFFLTEQLGKLKRRYHPTAEGHMAALSSSYGRFNEHLDSMVDLSNHSVRHYTQLARDLFKKYYEKQSHPKMETMAEYAFQNWIQGDKTLIFCFYIRTLEELSGLVEAKIKRHIDQNKHEITDKLGQEAETFRNSVSLSKYSSSLVFKDNLFKVSLYPLLEEHKISTDQILTINDYDVSEITKYLYRINFNPGNVNFSKLLTGLTYFAFETFYRKHKKLIPIRLRDDFEFILDKDQLKEIFRKLDKTDGAEDNPKEDRKQRLAEIENYVRNLIADKTRLYDYLMHPTIWENHREALEELDIDIRIKITEIVSAYLTSDEFLYLELLPQFKNRPDVKDIPKAYVEAAKTKKESTHDKVSRFLETAADMAKENLDLLADEMNYRYQKNKNNAERVIVETVSGDDKQDGKLRTVTAFKTPLPPYILLSTSVLAEGVDLHTECRHVVHYDHEWNPAKLEQKNGRVDRVGSKAERFSEKIEIQMPFIKHTQDEKAYRVVMARKSWFDTIMGENYEAKWDVDKIDEESLGPLPERIKEELKMELDNEAHLKFLRGT